jgi:inosine/xanthosine triphosphatase
MPAEKTVAIGSKNPVKITAVKNAFRKVFPGEAFKFIPVSVLSKVPAQPRGLSALRGARNRALAAKKLAHADYGVGLEGGMRRTQFGWFVEGWVAVSDAKGKVSFGSGGGAKIPSAVAKKILSDGLEMGHATDSVFGTKNIKHDIGLGGLLTDGFASREIEFTQACTIALASRRILSKLGDL